MVDLIRGFDITRPLIEAANRYTFTKLADTKNNFTAFGDIDLNNFGIAAFSASKASSGVDGIYTSDGKKTTTIADTNTLSTLFKDRHPFPSGLEPQETGPRSYSFGGNVEINDLGNVLFDAKVRLQFQSGTQIYDGLFLRQGDAIKEVAERSGFEIGSISETPRFTGFEINNLNHIVYAIEQQIITTRPFTSTSIVVDVKSIAYGLTNYSSSNGRVYSPHINNQGDVYFAQSGNSVGNESEADVNNIFKLKSGSSKPVALANQRLNVESLSVNDFGNIVFSGTVASGESGFFRIDKDMITKIGNFSAIANINDFGEVAFQPTQTDTSTGIFTQFGKLTEKVITPGDSLSGDKVAKIQFGELNDLGQIAFTAEFPDGTKGIFRANPFKYKGWDDFNHIIDQYLSNLGNKTVSLDPIRDIFNKAVSSLSAAESFLSREIGTVI